MYGCESWTIKKAEPKSWCFWTVVLEKTLESPLDCKEIKPVNFNAKGNQFWIFIGRAESEASVTKLNLFSNKVYFLKSFVCLCASVFSLHSPPHPTLMLARSYPVLLVLFLSIFNFCCCIEWGLSFQCIFWLLFAYVKITYVLLYWILLLLIVVFSWLSCIFHVYSHIMCKE